MIRIAMVAVVAIAAIPIATAGEFHSPLQIAQHIFTAADTDQNGALSPAEHEAAGLGRHGIIFADFDVDQDSQITWNEYKTVFERYHKTSDERAA